MVLKVGLRKDSPPNLTKSALTHCSVLIGSIKQVKARIVRDDGDIYMWQAQGGNV
jgi:hypothetical protein